LSDTLQELLHDLASEGQRDSGGMFTLAAEKVTQRYRNLLEHNPELPWLRFLQYCYRVRARRYRCVMGRSDCLLSLAGSLELTDIVESLRRYPDPPNGDAQLLHQVLWLFLAQQPGSQVLTVRLPGGHLRLEVGADTFALTEKRQPVEEDLQLQVSWTGGWLAMFREARRRASVQREMARRLFLFPGVAEWDGGLPARPLPFPGRIRLAIVHLVTRAQADRVAHFAYPPLRATKVVFNSQLVQQDLPRASDPCDWLVLESKSGQSNLSGERWRARLFFAYCVSSQPALMWPILDGCLLSPVILEGWPAGITLLAACPPDLRCDYSGLKLVDDPSLRGFLSHLRKRYAQTLYQLVRGFDCGFATLGDLLATP
jgi:hypothetical protein